MMWKDDVRRLANVVLAYLMRDPCTRCHVDHEGDLVYCPPCHGLYSDALRAAREPKARTI